eukprot:380834-Ditylum_brightwellii.AAC.1
MFSVCIWGKAKRVANAYVDDTDNTYVNKRYQKEEGPTAICDGLSKIAQTWEQLLLAWAVNYLPRRHTGG